MRIAKQKPTKLSKAQVGLLAFILLIVSFIGGYLAVPHTEEPLFESITALEVGP
jgi:hypothetical protein